MPDSFETFVEAPPGNEIYRVAEYKARLMRAGADEGFATFASAYPDPPMHRESVAFGSLYEYARNAALEYRELDARAGSAFVAPSPRTIGENDAIDFTGIARHFFLACLRDVIVSGRSALVRTDARGLIDVQGDEGQRGRDRYELDPSIFAVENGIVHVVVPDRAPEREFDEAFVALLGPHTDAFGHWLWHQLPRFVSALDAGNLAPMPVLIDRVMPPSHREALELAIGERAMPIVELATFERARVSRAWYSSTAFWLPYLPVSDGAWTWQHEATSPDRWVPIVESLRRGAGRIDASDVPERIFLARRPNLRRRLVNTAAIETLARDRGFAIVYPEELSFAAQLRAIRGARFIAGPEGSAMMLSLYARDGTRLLILDHPFTAQLTNLTAPLEANGIDVTLMTGNVVAANDSAGYPNFGFSHYADYAIDEHRLAAFLDGWT